MNIYKLLLCLYPRAWRNRYEEEMLTILTTRSFSFFEGIDVIRSALDAHLHPNLGMIDLSLAERGKVLVASLRCSLLIIFCAYVSFILAGMGFQKLTEASNLQMAAQQIPLVGISFQIIVLGAIFALLVVLIGGLPILTTVIASALAHKRWRSLLMLTVPIITFIAFLWLVRLLEVIDHPDSQFIWQTYLYRTLFLVTLITSAIISSATICRTVAQTELSGRLLHFAVRSSLLTTGAMILVVLSTIVWGIGLHKSAPSLFAGNEGIMSTSTMTSWLGIVIAMTIATILALFFLLRSLSISSMLRNVAA